jgi:hypothetical protein
MLRNILYVLVGTILFIGFFFKLMHWPGAGPMLSVSLCGISILSVMYAIRNRKSQLWIQHIIFPVFLNAFALSVLFKIMHWPCASVLLVISMTGISLTFFEGAQRMRKSITAVIPAMFGLSMMLALFKIMHWPSIDLLSFLILFLMASIPVLLFIRGKQLKQTAPSLSSQMMMVAALTLISALIEFSFVIVRDGLDLNHSLADFAQVLISLGILIAIGKVIQKENLKSNSQNDYLLLHCLGGIYLISLIFQIMKSWS